MILKEFDPNTKAVINPEDLVEHDPSFPKTMVTCYSAVLFDRMVENYSGRKIWQNNNASHYYDIYKISVDAVDLALSLTPVGAPAAVAMTEDLLVRGIDTVVMFGSCGVLDKSIEDCGIIIPDSALRDEGTSYHYAPYSDEIAVNEDTLPIFAEFLDERGVRYTVGKTWTTDGGYRETRDKVIKRQQQGCICVDMECSAMSALMKFRNKRLLHFFYAADNLDLEEWDKRSLGNHDSLDAKDVIADLAIRAACLLAKSN